MSLESRVIENLHLLNIRYKMTIATKDQLKIYLAYRDIFQGKNANIRQPKIIRRKLQETGRLQRFEKFECAEVIEALRVLLERNAFTSKKKAIEIFPALKPKKEADADDTSTEETNSDSCEDGTSSEGSESGSGGTTYQNDNGKLPKTL